MICIAIVRLLRSIESLSSQSIFYRFSHPSLFFLFNFSTLFSSKGHVWSLQPVRSTTRIYWPTILISTTVCNLNLPHAYFKYMVVNLQFALENNNNHPIHLRTIIKHHNPLSNTPTQLLHRYAYSTSSPSRKRVTSLVILAKYLYGSAPSTMDWAACPNSRLPPSTWFVILGSGLFFDILSKSSLADLF